MIFPWLPLLSLYIQVFKKKGGTTYNKVYPSRRRVQGRIYAPVDGLLNTPVGTDETWDKPQVQSGLLSVHSYVRAYEDLHLWEGVPP